MSLACLGAGILPSLVVLLALILTLKERENPLLIKLSPLLLFSSLYLALEFSYSELPQLWSYLSAERSFFDQLREFRGSLLSYHSLFQRSLSRFSLLLSFFLVLIFLDKERFSAALNGLKIGLVPALAAPLLQWFLPELRAYVPSASSYWLQLERMQGSFFDPNSFAMASLLAAALIFYSSRAGTGWRLCSLALILVATLSGSRSLLLGVLLVIGFEVLFRLFDRRQGGAFWALSRQKILTMTLLFSVLIGLLAYFQPPSLSRLAQHSSIQSFFFNKSVVWEAGAARWLDSPYWGVGVGRLSRELPLALERQAGVAPTWSDNANNLYLDLIAEWGLLGLVFLFLALPLISFEREQSSRGLRAIFLSFLLLCFFGPHIYAAEVCLLFALVVWGVGARVSKRALILKASKGRVPALVLLLILASFVSTKRSAGVYNFEWDGDSLFTWLAPNSQLSLPCDEAELSLELRSPLQPIEELKVLFNEKSLTVSLERGEATQILVPCRLGLASLALKTEEATRAIDLGLGEDRRLLALQLDTRL